VITGLDEGHASIFDFIELNGKIYAYGYEILKAGEAGSLFEVYRAPDGWWNATHVAMLPSAATYHAIGPKGEMLLGDGPNEYAVINNQIVPLNCDKVLNQDYFARFR